MNSSAFENSNTSKADRRRHTRYRFSVPLKIHLNDGTSHKGMSIEISESGISVATAVKLAMGDTVQLEPIGGSKVTTVIRHISGHFYGFEFLNITSEQVERIREGCQVLPVFRTSLTI